jgi:hypothetical protein
VRVWWWTAARRWRSRAAWTAMADGGSYQQLACGRETVCQRDRSILKSPAHTRTPGYSALPSSLDRQIPGAACSSRSVRDSGDPSGASRCGTENACLNPDSQPAMTSRFPQGSSRPPRASAAVAGAGWKYRRTVSHPDVTRSLTMMTPL